MQQRDLWPEMEKASPLREIWNRLADWERDMARAALARAIGKAAHPESRGNETRGDEA